MEEIQRENQAFVDEAENMYPDDGDDGGGDGTASQDFLQGLITSDPADSTEIQAMQDHLNVGKEAAEFLAVRNVWSPADKVREGGSGEDEPLSISLSLSWDGSLCLSLFTIVEFPRRPCVASSVPQN